MRIRKNLRESEDKISWDDFSDPVTDALEKKYLPSRGDGDNMATQAVTATCKLIYKWFNDGDVYDNTYGMEGWANDISGSANWLAKFVPGANEILMRIKSNGDSRSGYTKILYDLNKLVFNEDLLTALESQEKIGNAYREDGPFVIVRFAECDECGERVEEDEIREGLCPDCYQRMMNGEFDEEDEDW